MIKLFGKLGMFVGGVLFGTAGIAILKSDDAKTADEINEERARRKEEKEIADARALLSACEKED